MPGPPDSREPARQGGFIDRTALERSLSALREHRAAEPPGAVLHQVLGATRELLATSGAGLMLVDENSALCAVMATDEPGRMLEARQEQAGRGPCVDALVLGQITVTADLSADRRWPELLPDLPQAGVRAVLGLPIHLGGAAVGSLNVYRNEPHDWDPTEIDALRSYGGLVEGVLGAALHAHQRTELADQLQHALDHRVIIDRAVGAIMAREGVDPVTAFNQLRLTARSAARRVVDVAGELLSSLHETR
ncbi:MAG TPA: GAF and ANTAR domain-containing protein [Solirubrobacteraceae bacterium]|nr:GAF and ANTAR domain-containing protein [Solirubrobacteraceae bacterium]